MVLVSSYGWCNVYVYVFVLHSVIHCSLIIDFCCGEQYDGNISGIYISVVSLLYAELGRVDVRNQARTR